MSRNGETLVLITGANGQLGRELGCAQWMDSFRIRATTRAELDITDRSAVLRMVETLKPEVIVNAAAYTAVDRAEAEVERTFATNATAVQHLADAADAVGALLVQISTDYVFDGSKEGWYVEDDPIRPLNAYGRSKAGGEAAALAARRSLIVRTAWTYGVFGSNFVLTMLRLRRERDELGVVGDQFGCPTGTADLARAIIELIGRRADLNYRIYHVAPPDDASWFQFARAIFDECTLGPPPVLRQLATHEYPTAATRPKNSRLATQRLVAELGHGLPSWRQSLPPVVAGLEKRWQTSSRKERA